MIKKYSDISQKIGKYFIVYEFACPHCNTCLIDTELIELLDAVREKIKAPLIITSGYRCKEHNAEIGGAPDSKHMYGIAADVTTPKLTTKELYNVFEEILKNKGGLGYYPARGFVHVDLRKEYARWYEIKKGVYIPLTKEKKNLLGLI